MFKLNYENVRDLLMKQTPCPIVQKQLSRMCEFNRPHYCQNAQAYFLSCQKMCINF